VEVAGRSPALSRQETKFKGGNMQRETATLLENNKRNRFIYKEQVTKDLKAVVESLAYSNLDAGEIVDVIEGSGLIIPNNVLQNWLAARYQRKHPVQA
jgi:hypothetical protein